MTTISDVRARAADNVYPSDVLEGCETALILFAGGFDGAQDGAFIADAGLRGTCVDIRPDGLRRMEAVYPADWQFVCADVLEFTESLAGKWDVVSVDGPSGMFQQCADLADRWCALARHAVVLGSGYDTFVPEPAGWEITQNVARSAFRGGVYWTVLEPAGEEA